jgi:MOSC domain-containing protein YiiM
MGSVAHIFLARASRQPVCEVESGKAIADSGLEGCRHCRPGRRRQVLLVDGDALASLGLQPGWIKENITTEGLRVDDLARGQRLVIGGAEFEVTMPCEPCERMDEIRPGLQEELAGRRGMLCRVIRGGTIRRGDKIQIVEAAKADTILGGMQ